MHRNGKIILSAVIAIAAMSVLFAVVPASETFVISYVFAVIAIFGIAGTLCLYGKGSSKAAAGLSYFYASIIYAVFSVIFSVIACLISFSALWTLAVHIILLAIFAVRFVVSNIGSDYVNEIDKKSEAKHSEFLNEKKDYWE